MAIDSVSRKDVAGTVPQCKQPDFSLNFSQVYVFYSLRTVIESKWNDFVVQ